MVSFWVFQKTLMAVVERPQWLMVCQLTEQLPADWTQLVSGQQRSRGKERETGISWEHQTTWTAVEELLPRTELVRGTYSQLELTAWSQMNSEWLMWPLLY